jgi:hypothetical protein
MYPLGKLDHHLAGLRPRFNCFVALELVRELARSRHRPAFTRMENTIEVVMQPFRQSRVKRSSFWFPLLLLATERRKNATEKRETASDKRKRNERTEKNYFTCTCSNGVTKGSIVPTEGDPAPKLCVCPAFFVFFCRATNVVSVFCVSVRIDFFQTNDGPSADAIVSNWVP